MRTQVLIFFCLVNLVIYSQVPYTHISSSTFNAERVASFGVVDVSTDFLEITNSTQFDNSFIPSIWAHQESDTRFVLRHFATTTSSKDNGDIPIMIFRTEIRNNLNYIAPVDGSFPWGTTASNILNRPLFAWENGNTQLMRILANGNVGINTTTPTALLHTVGSLRFQNLIDSSSPFRLLGVDSNGNVYRYSPSDFGGGSVSDFDWLKPDGTIPTSINDNIYTNGKVAINTNVFPSQVGNVNVSSYSLFVTGGILTEEVRVALVENWADFVFEDGYPLESLEKVEEHIKEKKHLKGVPSEKEVKEDGIELVEMNKILLMKVEELTLYVIELNKRLNAQQEEIKQLKDIKK